MKKLFALLLVVMLLISLSACGKDKSKDDKKETETTQSTAATQNTTGTEDTTVTDTSENKEQPKTVTIYIPKTQEIIPANGSNPIVHTYVYEEGWREKDTFTVTLENELGAYAGIKQTISNKKVISETALNGSQSVSEVHFDENGWVIKTIKPATPAYGSVESPATEGKYETVNTYDEKGRLVKVEGAYYPFDGREPTTEIKNYTYQETDEGSESREVSGPNNEQLDDPLLVQPSRKVFVYNKDNCLIKEITLMGEQEINRSEYTYNEHSIQTSVSYYVNGELNFTQNTTYEAVEVSPEKAAMLPWAK